MPSNYKAFTVYPTKAFVGKTDTEADLDTVLQLIADDVVMVSQVAEWQLKYDDNLLDDLDRALTSTDKNGKLKRLNPPNNSVGRTLGITFPKELVVGRASGNSRLEEIYRDKVIRDAKSWLERVRAVEKRTDKWVSQGWRRTANPNRPTGSNKISLSAADQQYSAITNDPAQDGEIHLLMVAEGNKYTLVFPYDKERFSDSSKVCLPDIVADDTGVPVFTFTSEYESNYTEFSSDFVVGIDVGIVNPVSIVVTNKNGDIVHATTSFSERIDSLHNSVKATQNQIEDLWDKIFRSTSIPEIMTTYDEIVLQRRSLSRKRKELAILLAQEIAEVSYVWDNALVAFEDLSWREDTMANGRWNIGQIRKWTKHYVELNGGRVMSVDSKNTSQECYMCGEQVKFHDWHVVSCSCGMHEDRDINAAANVADRLRDKVLSKAVATRKKSRKVTKTQTRRSPVTRSSLKYPGRNKTRKPKGGATTPKKGVPTPKQVRCPKRVNSKILQGVNDNNGSAGNNNDCDTVAADGRFESESSTRTLEKQPSLSTVGTRSPDGDYSLW